MRNRWPYPRIYEAYEESIGMSTPAVIHSLNAAAQRWPEQWIVEALRLAGGQDQPTWHYAQGILQRRERGQPMPERTQRDR